MEIPNFNLNEINDLFSQIGLVNPKGKAYNERQKNAASYMIISY